MGRNITKSILEVGARLNKAKASPGRKSWRTLAKDAFGMPEYVATNYMRLAERFGGDERFFDFNVEALLALAKLSPAEVEEFLRENPDAHKFSISKLYEKIKG